MMDAPVFTIDFAEPLKDNLTGLLEIAGSGNGDREAVTVPGPYLHGSPVDKVVVSPVAYAGRVHQHPDAVPSAIVRSLLLPGTGQRQECRKSTQDEVELKYIGI